MKPPAGQDRNIPCTIKFATNHQEITLMPINRRFITASALSSTPSQQPAFKAEKPK